MLLLLVGLAAYRLWRLVARDSITEPLRDWLRRWPRVALMVECPWCLGSWVAFGVTWATDAWIGLAAPALVGLASAVIVGFVGMVDD